MAVAVELEDAAALIAEDIFQGAWETDQFIAKLKFEVNVNISPEWKGDIKMDLGIEPDLVINALGELSKDQAYIAKLNQMWQIGIWRYQLPFQQKRGFDFFRFLFSDETLWDEIDKQDFEQTKYHPREDFDLNTDIFKQAKEIYWWGPFDAITEGIETTREELLKMPIDEIMSYDQKTYDMQKEIAKSFLTMNYIFKFYFFNWVQLTEYMLDIRPYAGIDEKVDKKFRIFKPTTFDVTNPPEMRNYFANPTPYTQSASGAPIRGDVSIGEVGWRMINEPFSIFDGDAKFNKTKYDTTFPISGGYLTTLQKIGNPYLEDDSIDYKSLIFSYYHRYKNLFKEFLDMESKSVIGKFVAKVLTHTPRDPLATGNWLPFGDFGIDPGYQADNISNNSISVMKEIGDRVWFLTSEYSGWGDILTVIGSKNEGSMNNYYTIHGDNNILYTEVTENNVYFEEQEDLVKPYIRDTSRDTKDDSIKEDLLKSYVVILDVGDRIGSTPFQGEFGQIISIDEQFLQPPYYEVLFHNGSTMFYMRDEIKIVTKKEYNHGIKDFHREEHQEQVDEHQEKIVAKEEVREQVEQQETKDKIEVAAAIPSGLRDYQNLAIVPYMDIKNDVNLDSNIGLVVNEAITQQVNKILAAPSKEDVDNIPNLVEYLRGANAGRKKVVSGGGIKLRRGLSANLSTNPEYYRLLDLYGIPNVNREYHGTDFEVYWRMDNAHATHVGHYFARIYDADGESNDSISFFLDYPNDDNSVPAVQERYQVFSDITQYLLDNSQDFVGFRIMPDIHDIIPPANENYALMGHTIVFLQTWTENIWNTMRQFAGILHEAGYITDNQFDLLVGVYESDNKNMMIGILVVGFIGYAIYKESK